MLRRRQMITGLVVAVIAVLLLSACGVTRNEWRPWAAPAADDGAEQSGQRL